MRVPVSPWMPAEAFWSWVMRAVRPGAERAKRMAAIERAAVNLVLANRRLEAQRQQEAQKG